VNTTKARVYFNNCIYVKTLTSTVHFQR